MAHLGTWLASSQVEKKKNKNLLKTTPSTWFGKRLDSTG